MSIRSITAAQETPRFISTDLKQTGSGSPLILQMPIEILKLLASWVATGSNLQERAENSLRLGQVCVYTHLLSRDKKIAKIIDGRKIDIATVDLAKTIFEREITGLETGRFSPTDKQALSTERKKINILYTIFKEYVFKYHKKTGDEFASQSVTIQLNIQTLCLKLGESTNNAFEGSDLHRITLMKIASTLKKFTGKTIENMIAEYASQPLENITIENFKEKMLHLEDQFKEIRELVNLDSQEYPPFLEAKIRIAILARHSAEEFNTVIHSLFFSAKNALATQLKEEKAALEKEERHIIARKLPEIESTLYLIECNYETLQRLNNMESENLSSTAVVARRHWLVKIPGFNTEIAKICQFYNELSNREFSNQSEQRSYILHRIID
jgi:hypothetical protein